MTTFTRSKTPAIRFALSFVLLLALPTGCRSPDSTPDDEPGAISDIHFGHPNWSPRGDRIAVDCGPAGKLDLCLVEVATGRIEQITFTPEIGEAVPVFSPDGSRLSFSQEQDDAWYLSVIDLETRDAVELVRLTMPYASSSSWAPDGEHLAFDMLNDAGDHDIFTVHLGSSEVRPLITGPGSQRFAAYAPDAKHLAYVQIDDDHGDIVVARLDGSEPRIVVSHPADEGVPAWSPDSRQLSYYSRRSGDFEVFVTDLSGTERRLTTNAAFDIFASFSPDGRAIVFESTRDRNPDGFDQGVDIYRLDLESNEITRLTRPEDFPGSDSDRSQVAGDSARANR